MGLCEFLWIIKKMMKSPWRLLILSRIDDSLDPLSDTRIMSLGITEFLYYLKD